MPEPAPIRVAVADIGGTNARFALAEIAGGEIVSLGAPFTVPTGSHPSLASAWEAFRAASAEPLPAAASIALASRLGPERIKLTNNEWVIRPAGLCAELGLEDCLLVNDFGAVAHAVAALGEDGFSHLCGPDRPLPERGAISVIGPGTGLGTALLIRRRDGYHVVETEGGHVGFAPFDEIEDRILAHLRRKYGRVSVERLAAGMGLANIEAALAADAARPPLGLSDRDIWVAAGEDKDPRISKALSLYLAILGGAAGDLALAHGAHALVLAGGVGRRIAHLIPNSNFHARFLAKGRFESQVAALPIKLITHEEPGLYGAAAAYAQRRLA